MKYRLLATLGLICHSAVCGAAEPRFHPPVRLEAGGAPIRVETPGHAAPCLADLDGDGQIDLLVGQFNGGKIQVFKGLGKGKFDKGTWLEADGKPAEVPGI